MSLALRLLGSKLGDLDDILIPQNQFQMPCFLMLLRYSCFDLKHLKMRWRLIHGFLGTQITFNFLCMFVALVMLMEQKVPVRSAIIKLKWEELAV